MCIRDRIKRTMEFHSIGLKIEKFPFFQIYVQIGSGQSYIFERDSNSLLAVYGECSRKWNSRFCLEIVKKWKFCESCPFQLNFETKNYTYLKLCQFEYDSAAPCGYTIKSLRHQIDKIVPNKHTIRLYNLGEFSTTALGLWVFAS